MIFIHSIFGKTIRLGERISWQALVQWSVISLSACIGVVRQVQCVYLKYKVLMSQPQKNKRHAYNKITEQVRSAIITRITEGGQPMREVAQSMGVNISTCKAILKVFQEEGRIGKKKKRNKVVNVVETFSFYCINDGHVEQVEEVKLQESKLSLKRNQNLDKVLEDNARAKAEKMLDGIVENKRRADENAIEMQRQIEAMQNNFAQFYAINPYLFPQQIILPFPHHQGSGHSETKK